MRTRGGGSRIEELLALGTSSIPRSSLPFVDLVPNVLVGVLIRIESDADFGESS